MIDGRRSVEGARLCDLLAAALRESTTVAELAARLEDPRAVVGHCFGEDLNTIARDIAGSISPEPRFDLVYSEMVASFMATPPLLAFRSAFYTGLGRAAAESDRTRVTDAASAIWQRFNDVSIGVHLSALAQLLRPQGELHVAADTEKRFDDPGLSVVRSFLFDANQGPSVLADVPLDRERPYERGFTWRDHDDGFDVHVCGIPVADFLSHEHRVHVFVYRKD